MRSYIMMALLFGVIVVLVFLLLLPLIALLGIVATALYQSF